MAVHKFNITRAKEYVASDGQTKKIWLNVGTMTVFEKQDGSVSRIIELNDRDTVYQVFPIEPKKSEQTAPAPQPAPQQQYQNDEIRVENMPF